jgi:hypothetical protein
MSDAHEHMPTLLGYRKGGQPIFLVQGAAESPAPAEQDPTSEPTPVDDPSVAGETGDQADQDEKQPAELGDAGKQAIDKMKQRMRDEATKRRAAETELAAIKAKAAAEAGDQQATAEQIKADARKEAQTEIAQERALDRVEVLAAKSFADPADARVFLASHVDDFIDDGQVDIDAINEALTELLKTRPYLAAGAPRKWTATGDGGVRGGKPKDLDAQIAEALAKGDTAGYIRLQNQKFSVT